MRLVQIARPGERRVGVVEGDALRLLARHRTVYEAAGAAMASGRRLAATVEADLGAEVLDYASIHASIHAGESEWRLLPPVDHPDEPARCLLSGTGLTHTQSAANRDAMHAGAQTLTDSMRMYQWGVEKGKPAAGAIGIAPEWFYKGCGTNLRAHGEPLIVPKYAEDGGEEPEIAGVYMVDAAGGARRLGMAQGNEFSDHGFERRNYLNLAGSKLRTCAIGPELVLDADFQRVPGTVTIEREGKGLWRAEVVTGEEAMSHSLANIEHHHFKFAAHRRPGDVHIHFFGASAFSFGAGVILRDGDVMEVSFQGFGRPLRNPVGVAGTADELVTAPAL